ncbi:hypothetical protein BGZ99_005925 [Dissophora globulifera]|uniref:polynucleotide adenylyltransferase n=1 Tax=Dissophora globulifera TaxID=979702 RepID=A0A9P6RHP7_9FUNG|nr:hypothetical protein BGZ99_005925 [Dissophora globulifera]
MSVTSTASKACALTPAELKAASTGDGGEFVGILYDTILYERACHRLYTLKKYDFPIKYEDIAQDFLTAFNLCRDSKFLANRHTAVFHHLILRSKLVSASGVRKFAEDYLGKYEIFPMEENLQFDEEDLEELDEDDFSDYDSVSQAMRPVQKNVGYEGPMLTRRSQGHYGGPIAEGQAHRESFEQGYSAADKYSQDMIAVIIAHLRKRVWYHVGSGGETVKIINMGVDLKISGTQASDQPIENVKGVKKYSRRYNSKMRRRNFAKRLERNTVRGNFINARDHLADFTDYTDSETENAAVEADGVGDTIDRLAAISLTDITGSPKRPIRWLPGLVSDTLYDWNGINKDLRLIQLPAEDDDPDFYGCLTRDIMAKYKQLLPPSDLVVRHQQLKTNLENIITAAFPYEEIQVEAFGSFVSGLLTTHSDADFCISGTNIHGHTLLNNMDHIARILRTDGMENVVAVPHAMVPIVKFKDPRTNLECDLNTGNNLGVVNSELIRIYTTIDERVKPFLYLVKAICKAQGINNSRDGYLSSYAITWIGIVFLQQDLQNTPSTSTWGWSTNALLPKLQQQSFERMKERTLRINHNTKKSLSSTTSLVNSSRSNMVHCRYDDNSDGKHTGSGLVNTKSLARLLIEFFEFFSRHFNYKEVSIHAGRAQFLPKSLKDLQGERPGEPTFRVVDPFLHHRNITGTCRGPSLGMVWEAFDHAYRMLSAGDLEGALTPRG